MKSIIDLVVTKRTDPSLLSLMDCHYSHPRGFVGRSICYAVLVDGWYYGHIVAGSACRHLPGRHEFLGTSDGSLNSIISNIFFSVSRGPSGYPMRNFTTAVVKEFVARSIGDWKTKYGDDVVGFETLVELPRTGELYKRAGWSVVGQTVGYTCKRIGGSGTDSWSGKRVWDTTNLRPKLVLCYKL